MRVDMPVVVPPPRPVQIAIAWLLAFYYAVGDLLEGTAAPSLAEMGVLGALGLAFGFVVIAFALQAVLMFFVMTLGLAWGMVLGLLMERLRPQTAEVL